MTPLVAALSSDRAGSVAHVAESAPFTAHRLEVGDTPRFNSVDAALAWCGAEHLRWTHATSTRGESPRSVLIGHDEKDNVRAVVRGPLLAVLPESIDVEVRSPRHERVEADPLDVLVDDLERCGFGVSKEVGR
jgi:hypothetical protein